MDTLRNRFLKGALLGLSFFSLIIILVPSLMAHAAPLDANPSTTTFENGILPKCDPTFTDLKGGTVSPKTGLPACGLNEGIQLIYNIIKYLTYIIIPIAVLLLGYAGFTIMTSAGNSEKMSQAKHMVELVAIGLAIIFLSSIIEIYLYDSRLNL
jgi:hypothetical protein